MTFDSEITAPVRVEVADATRATPGRWGDAPERCYDSERESVDLTVWLGGIDVTGALSADVLDALASEALERLAEP